MVKHVMVDIETWGKGPTAQIIAIGAVKFDPEDVTATWESFHVAVDPRGFTTLPGLHPPFEVDPDTIMWWMSEKQAAARTYWLACVKLDLATALSGFAEWFGPESLPTWGNGATFDNVILGHAFKACGIPRPWSYKDDRCYRTLRAEWPDVKGPTDEAMQERFGGHLSHTALSDAQWQAWHLTRIYAAKHPPLPSFDDLVHPPVERELNGIMSGRIPPLKVERERDEMIEAARELHRKDPDLKHRQAVSVEAAAAEMRALPDRAEDRVAMARAMNELIDDITDEQEAKVQRYMREDGEVPDDLDLHDTEA